MRVMDWSAPWSPVIVALTVVVGLAIGGMSWRSGLRRRRAHISLIRESANRMESCLDQPPSPTACRHRELAGTIVEQQDIAQRLEREIRPRITVLDADDLVDTLHMIVLVLSGGDEQHAVEVAPDGSIGPVPTVDATELDDLYTVMADTVAARVRQANAVLSHARKLRIIDSDVDSRLTDLIAATARSEQDSRRLAGAGLPVAALHELTRFDLPMPDDGVPAEATRRDLERQAEWLDEIAAGHRVEILAWCGNALHRRAQVDREERTAP